MGAGLCGASAAEALRTRGFDGDVVLIGDEPHLPYQRPPLSKEYLQGREDAAALFVKPEDWYARHDVEVLVPAAVRRIDPVASEVEVADGTRVPYDRVLIATGGRPRRLVEETERIRYLRTKGEADALAAHLEAGRSLVVVGAGFIGCEVAASARARGVHVTMLEAFEVPLERTLGADVGRLIGDIHREHGVDLRTGEQVTAITDTGGQVLVETGCARIEADAALVGVGLVPNIEMVEGTGVRVDDGIVVDEHCRTTTPGIYAAGDVARHHHPLFGRHMRVEHYDNAIKQGVAAAANMLDAGVVYDDPHWFWSDQYEHNLQSVGVADVWDEVVVRGSLESRSFAAFYLHEGRVRALLAFDRPKDALRGRKLVQTRTPVIADDVRDEAADLRRLTMKRR